MQLLTYLLAAAVLWAVSATGPAVPNDQSVPEQAQRAAQQNVPVQAQRAAQAAAPPGAHAPAHTR